MSLLTRLSRLEARHPAKQGKWRCVTALSEAEADAREAEMRTSGEIGPDDHLMRIIFTGPSESGSTGMVAVRTGVKEH
jgi:hypothetical protein